MANITEEELESFFEAHAKPCYVCGSERWLVVPSDQPLIVPVLSTSGEFKFPPLHIPAYAVICKQCGYIHMHELNIVRDWAESKRTHE